MGCQNPTLSGGRWWYQHPGGGLARRKVIRTWAIKDKIDGLAGDPVPHEVIVTLNEDANTHLATVAPSAPSGQQVTYYSYSPSPQSSAAPAALQSGGGTDHVSVDSVGNVPVTGSHARLKAGTAVFSCRAEPAIRRGPLGMANQDSGRRQNTEGVRFWARTNSRNASGVRTGKRGALYIRGPSGSRRAGRA